jgi:hypothetical protein
MQNRIAGCNPYLLGIIALIATAAPGAAQQTFQITAPFDGTHVQRGQGVVVTISVPSASSFLGVSIIGTGNIGAAGPLTASPFTFVLTVPADLSYGPYQLTAVGIDSSGNLTTSPSITLNVDPTSSLSALSVTPVTVKFKYTGQQIPLQVIGTFADGSTADLTRSTLTSYTSSKPSSATIAAGIATAVGGSQPGAVFNVTYGGVSATVPFSVPNAIRGDLNGDGVVDMNDLNIITIALNTPASGPFDARDLNKDGVINALDSRILVTLCTRPGCATH